MAALLKLVCLGGVPEEAQSLMEAQSAAFEAEKVEQGVVAGSRILRFEGSVEREKTRQRFAIFSIAGQPDFRSVYQLLLSNADGVIALIPADLARCAESAKIFGHLQKSLQERKEEGGELPFLLQYHWGEKATKPLPVELDQALGVNPQAVEQVFTQAGAPEQENPILALLKKIEALGETASKVVVANEGER